MDKDVSREIDRLAGVLRGSLRSEETSRAIPPEVRGPLGALLDIIESLRTGYPEGVLALAVPTSSTEDGGVSPLTWDEWERLAQDASLYRRIAEWVAHNRERTPRGPRPEIRTVKITFGHTRVTVNGKPVNKDASWLLAEYLILRNGRVCWPWACVILPTFDVADPDGAFRNYLSKKRRTFNGCGIHFATHKKKTEDGAHVFEGMDDNIVSNIKNVKTMHDQALKEYEAGDRARAISLLSRITGDDQNDWYMFTAAYMDLARWICELHFEHVGERPIEKCRSFLRLSRLPWEFGMRPGNRRPLYAAASFLSSSVPIALINCGS